MNEDHVSDLALQFVSEASTLPIVMISGRPFDDEGVPVSPVDQQLFYEQFQHVDKRVILEAFRLTLARAMEFMVTEPVTPRSN